MSDGALACRRCDCLPILIPEKSGRERVRCPKCGVSGERENVTKLAAEHAASDLVDDFRQRLAQQFRTDKYVRFEPGSREHRSPPDFVFTTRSREC